MTEEGKNHLCKTRIRPLFPGYLFARFDPIEQYRGVKYAKGVRDIVEFDDSLAIVDEYVIDSIRSRLVDGILRIRKESIRVGQIVRIQHGVLAGLEAVLERELTSAQRVVLLLQAIAYQARIVVPTTLVSNM
jgi:transcriptional antiterminator RfaH